MTLQNPDTLSHFGKFENNIIAANNAERLAKTRGGTKFSLLKINGFYYVIKGKSDHAVYVTGRGWK